MRANEEITGERWCGGLMTRLSVQRFHVQIPVVALVNFDLFKAKIQDENSKAPGDTCRGPKGAVAQWYGRLIGCPCYRQVSDRFKSHAHGTRRTIGRGVSPPVS